MKFLSKIHIQIFIVGIISIQINANFINAPISHGELIDKITILEIKKDNIQDPEKIKNVIQELLLLESLNQENQEQQEEFFKLRKTMKAINVILWVIEDLIRAEEKIANFGNFFKLLARLVYFINDERAKIKRSINVLANSSIIEEKSYASYTKK